MDKTVKINLISVGVVLLIVFALGYFARRGVIDRKEIRNLHAQVAGKERVIEKMYDTINLKSDTINQLREVINSNSYKIASLKKEIKKLGEVKPIVLPPNQEYAELQELHPDTSVKPWPFSDKQVDGLYQDVNELFIKRQQIPKYESIVGMLTYNIQLLNKTDSMKTQQLETCFAVTDEYKKIVDIKDQEIKLWMKKGKGRAIWGLTSTGVAAVFLTLLLVK